MKDLRQLHGDHTWDIVMDYHQCPFCDFIVENRQKYILQEGFYRRDLICTRCNQPFTVQKKNKKI